MALITRVGSGTERFRVTSAAPASKVLTEEVERRRVPDGKVKGTFLTLQGGVKFRTSTPLAKSRAWTENKTQQSTTAVGRSGSIAGLELYYYGGGEVCLKQGLIHNSLVYDGYPNEQGMKDVNSPPFIPEGMRNEAITKSLNKLADQKVNLGENLATLHQVLQLLTHPTGSLASLVHELYVVGKSKKFWPYLRMSARDLRRFSFTGAAASEYLKYVYGWKPLMQDVHGLIELAKGSSGKSLLLHASQTARSQTKSRPKKVKDISGNRTIQVGGYDIKTLVRSSLWAEIDPNYSGSRAINQLGLLNPASLFWELVPFSFVVDWVLPIGPVLQALTAPAGLRFVDGSISSRVSASGDYSVHFDALTDGSRDVTLKTDSAATGLTFYEGYTREVIRSWPRPGLWVNSDPFGRGDRPWKALALSIIGLRGLSR